MDKRTSVIFYTFVFFGIVNGWYVSSFGPLIPFFSLQSGLDETYYSFIFFMRFIGCVIGGFLIKILIKIFTTQSLAIFLNLLLVISLSVTTISLSKYWLSFVIIVESIAYVGIMVIMYGVAFKLLQSSANQMQIVAFVFAAGAMTGPLLVIMLEMKIFLLVGLSHLIIIFSLLKYPWPDLDKNHNNEQKDNQNGISRKTQGFICLIMAILAANQLGFGSWIPTYAIKANISTPEESGIYSTIFWTSNCFGRLIWLTILIPITLKLYYSFLGLLITFILLLIMQYLQLYNGICTFGSFMVGMFTSSIYSFCLLLPADNGFKPSNSNTANFILANSFGQGFLITPIGYAMNYLSFKSLIVISFAITLIANWSLRQAKNEMKKDNLAIQNGQKKKKLIQVNQIGNNE